MYLFYIIISNEIVTMCSFVHFYEKINNSPLSNLVYNIFEISINSDNSCNTAHVSNEGIIKTQIFR